MATIRKVCRLAWDYPSAGKSTYGLQPVFVNLSEEQARQGYEVHVISRRVPPQVPEEVHNGVRIHRVLPPFNVSALRKTRELVAGDSEAVVHAHATCGIFSAPLQWVGAVRLVAHAHGTSRSHHVPVRYKSGQVYRDYSRIGVAYDMMRERLMWTSSLRILSVSRVLANDIEETYHVNPSKVRVVYNGVDTDVFRRTEGGAIPEPLKPFEGRRIILFVGHFGIRKGIFYMIRAMKGILSEVPDAHLVCIGGVPEWLREEDPWRVLRNEIESEGVGDHVTLLDRVGNRDLVTYYSMADVFVLPSYYESFSKVTLEAMACSLPVVASNMGGLPEMVVSGETGELVPYGSPPALTSTIVSLLEDPKRARAMGTLGRQRVEQMFTWKAVAKRVSTVYEEL